MEPSIPTDSVILVRKTDPSLVKVDDVISFYSSDPDLRGAVNTHRVISIEQNNGIYIFHTKGDANLVVDEYTVPSTDLIGVVVFSSLFLGRIIRLLSNPIVFIPIIMVPLLLLLIMNLFKTIRLAKAAAAEEEQKQMAEIKAELERRKALREEQQSKQRNDPADNEAD